MKALVLNKPGEIALEDVPDPGSPPSGQVRVKVGSVGICGSDVHYYLHGQIGDFVVKEPMVLGHETAGTVVEVGEGVSNLKIGDRVALEPGIPCGQCEICKGGKYNLCPDIEFWATPPYDGSLTEFVNHPAEYAFRLPDSMTIEEGALMEPLAVGVHACARGRIQSGDSVLILGAGTIGCVTLLAAKALGATSVMVADVVTERLERAKRLGADHVIDVRSGSVVEAVRNFTDGKGVSLGVDCSGVSTALQDLVASVSPGGRVVMVGMGPQPIEVDLVEAMVKEVDVMGVFRYAHAYPRAIDLVASGKIDVAPLVTDRFRFEESVAAFEYAKNPDAKTCKIMISLD